MVACLAFASAFVGVAIFVMPNGDDTSETGGEVGASWSGSGTSSDPWLISSASDLQAIATRVNAGNGSWSDHFKQTANIDLSGISNWTPIGISSTYCFEGYYDGGNYSIKNMTISATANYAGLFGYVDDNNSVIENIILENINISGSYSYMGGIVGYSPYLGTIENCFVTGSISGTGYLGAIVGWAYAVDIISCGSSVTITGTGSYVGGLAGHIDNGSIQKSFNTGAVSSTSSYVGGLAGHIEDWSTIENSYNTGAVSGSMYVGGIVGYFYGSSSTSYSYLKYNYNTGSVTASNSYVGGIAGRVAYGLIGSCWHYGSLINSASSSYAGGIAGSAPNSYDSYNYFYDTTGQDVSTDKAGGTQDSSLSTNVRNVSWVGYTNWSISTSGTTTWHLGSTNYPTVRSSAWHVGSGTTSDPFTVSTASELNKLSVLTSMGVKYHGLNFKQTANLNLSSYSKWTPIGKTSFIFGGNYDGDGFSISNVNVEGTGRTALFGYINGSTLKNIVLSNAQVNAPSGSSTSYFAGLAAYVTDSSIQNCSVLNSTVSGYSYVGGIAAYATTSSIIDCIVSGSVSATGGGYAGGIAGNVENSATTTLTITNCMNQASVSAVGSYVGGCFGYLSGNFSVSKCINNGVVNNSGSYTGGFAGRISGYSSSYYVTLDCCSNSGAVTGTSNSGGLVGYQHYYSNIYNCYNAGTLSCPSGSYVGGLVGYLYGYSSSSYPSRIEKTYNIGSVSGGSYVGGLIGYTYAGSRYSTLKYSYNVGTVSGTSYVGGISGRLYNTTYNTVTSCYWWTGCGATYAHAYNSSSSGSTGYADLTTQAKSSSWSLYTAYWDFTNIWMINSGVNGGYPIFKASFAVGSGGSGTSTDPFLISNLEDLQDLQKKVNSGTNYSGIYFKQTANIDMKNISSWTPIGNYSAQTIYFAGNYNGDGYTIANFTINNSSMYQGLFGYCYGATVSNLRMLNVNITSSAYSGAVAGLFVGNISNVSVAGTISGSSYAGGLVGAVTGTATISECFNLANITGGSSPLGGLVGGTSGALTINDCYNKGNITCSSGGYAGGLVGNSSASMYIYRSYNSGAIKTSSGTAGGLVGGASSNSYANMYNCYNLGTVSGSYVGGLSAGYGTNSSSYYDSSCGASYGIRSSSSTTGKTTGLSTQVKQSSWAGYSGWSSSVWLWIPTANGGLPVLKDFYWTGSGTGTESDPFKISSLANLQLLQTFVNKGEHYEGMRFSQTTSISLSSFSDWTPIGDYATNDFLWFSGYYDQNDYSIQYLNITANKNYRGLFGYAKNATFDDPYFIGSSSYVISASGASYVGTLLGYGLNCKIDKYDSSSGPAITGGQYTGAIAGYLGQGSVLTNSYLSQKVTGNGHYVGGMVGGLNASTMTGCYRSSSSSSYAINNSSYGYTGGLVGYSYNSTIDNCYAYTPVTGNMHVGGLVGILDCGTISNSYHTTGSVTAVNYAGGIVGQVYNTGKITACYNTGAVNATTKGAGGLAGLVGGTAKTKFATVEKSYNSGAITGAATTGGLVGLLDDYADLLNCYNSGSVTATGTYTGGLVGKIEAFEYNNTDSNYPTNIKYCYNKGAVKGTTYVGGIVGYIVLDNNHVTIAYSYNVGAVSSSSGATSIGGIAGYAPTSQTYSVMKFLTNYWDTDCGATYGVQNQTSVGGVTGYSTLDTSTYALNSSWSLYSYWDFTNTWRLLSNYNNGYPTFLWSLTKYTVYFYPNGGNESSYSITARYTEYITLPGNTFTRTGFTANGWNKSSTTLTSTPSYKAGDSYQVMGTTNFYANWTPIGMTLNLKVYIEHDLNGKNYELVTSAVSGLSVYFYYYNTTLSGSSTENVQMKSTGAAVSGSARVNQSVTVYVTPPSGYICTDIVVNNESPTYSSKITSKSVSIGTGLSGYSSSNYTGEVRVYIKKSSGNNVEFE